MPTVSADEVDNPQWKEIQHRLATGEFLLRQQTNTFRARTGSLSAYHELTVRFSSAIADPTVLAFVAEHTADKIVVVDAGLAYWPYLLRQLGKDVVAYADPGPTRRWGTEPVYKDRHRDQIRHHGDRTLLCVPSADRGQLWASLALDLYTGDTFAYVGPEPEQGHRLLGILNRSWILQGSMVGLTNYQDPRGAYIYKRQP